MIIETMDQALSNLALARSEIDRLRAELELWKDRANRARALLADHHPAMEDAAAQIDRLRVGLQWYAETFCEGWCKESHSTAAFDDCSGCKARALLAKTV